MTSPYASSMKSLEADGPLTIHIVKLYNATDMTTFDAFGRVMSGTVTVGQKVRVLGEGYTPDDEEDSSVQTVEALSIFESRFVCLLFPRRVECT